MVLGGFLLSSRDRPSVTGAHDEVVDDTIKREGSPGDTPPFRLDPRWTRGRHVSGNTSQCHPVVGPSRTTSVSSVSGSFGDPLRRGTPS